MLSFQLFTQLNCVIAVENILTRANYFNLSDPTVVLYWRAGGGLEISKRNRGIPPLVQAIPDTQLMNELSWPRSSSGYPAAALVTGLMRSDQLYGDQGP